MCTVRDRCRHGVCFLPGQGQDPQPHQPAAGVPAQPRGVALRAGGSHPAAQRGGLAAAGTAALLGKLGCQLLHWHFQANFFLASIGSIFILGAETITCVLSSM